MGISAGILGMMGLYMGKLMGWWKMNEISIKEVIAGMVSAYNDLLKEKDEDIADIKKDLTLKENRIKDLEQVVEDQEEVIENLNVKLKEQKKEKRAKKEKKDDEPEPTLI